MHCQKSCGEMSPCHHLEPCTFRAPIKSAACLDLSEQPCIILEEV